MRGGFAFGAQRSVRGGSELRPGSNAVPQRRALYRPVGSAGSVCAGGGEHWLSVGRTGYGFRFADNESQGGAVTALEQGEAGSRRVGGGRYRHRDERRDSLLLSQ